jgi:uncharacterized protein involved in oxidation of intracellular sulfur
MKALIVLNDGPYGSERSYNGFRLAGGLVKSSNNTVRMTHRGAMATAIPAAAEIGIDLLSIFFPS